MADLVSLPEIVRFLGLDSGTDEELLGELLDHVEGLFEAETGRRRKPFVASATRTEYQDGSGSPVLWLDYPLSTLTSVKLGHDATDPVETLTIGDSDILTYEVGSRRLARTDGGVFGRAGQERYVQIVYTHQADLPEDAQLAIKSACALLYRRRGSEDVKDSSLSGYSQTLATLSDDPCWSRAVAAHRRVVLA